jgi:hypothetical protein
MSRSIEVNAKSFSPDVLDFFRVLEKHDVDYMVVGGEAVIFHGYPRFTGDIDFFYGSSEPNLQRLFAALGEFWSGKIPGIESASELGQEGIVIQFGRPPHRIDLLNSIDGVLFEDAWPNRVAVQILGGGVSIRTAYLGKNELIQNKRASARPKDLDDVDHLAMP